MLVSDKGRQTKVYKNFNEKIVMFWVSVIFSDNDLL